LLLAVVALVATTSPITAAHAADDVTVDVVNSEGVPIDVWVDSLVKVQNLAVDASINITVSAGSHSVAICNIGSQATPSTASGCNQVGGSLAPLSVTQFDWAGGTNNTIVFGGLTCEDTMCDRAAGGSTFGFTNDLSATAAGNARFSLNNAGTGLALNVCFDGQGQKLTAVPSLASSATMAHGSEVEFPAGQPVSVRISEVANCVGADAILLDLAAGTNTVVTDRPGVYNVRVLIVDTVDVDNVPVQSAFCTALLSLQGIEAQIKATFGAVVALDPATSPSKFQVKSLVDTINAALKAGDTHVTNLEKNFWDQATQELEDLAAELTAAGFDWNKLDLADADQQSIIDYANGVNQDPDQAVVTAKEALTAFAVANCLSASTVKGSGPKFTG
jgi:hypothetical protein